MALTTEEYDQLAKAKTAVERFRNKNYSWGEFLVLVAMGTLIALGITTALDVFAQE